MNDTSSSLIDQASVHPAVLSIAVELIIHPARRAQYPQVTLALADFAIAMLRRRLGESSHTELASPST